MARRSTTSDSSARAAQEYIYGPKDGTKGGPLGGGLPRLPGTAAQGAGTESATALLGNASRLCSVLGTPSTPVEKMLGWTAHWVKLGGRDLGKPTHFEVRDGNY